MSDETFKIAVAGYGNIGQAIVNQAQKEVNDDMKLVGVIRRQVDGEFIEGTNIPQVSDVGSLSEKPDVVLVAAPSHIAPETTVAYLEKGIATVDCFDDHSRREEVRKMYNEAAIPNKTSAVMMSGWDPGIDSAVRALVDGLSPEGTTHTKFGGKKGGKSMGHTTTVKSIEGVKDAVSITKEGTKLNKHVREVYVVPEKNADVDEIARQIMKHPYFKNDDTTVYFVSKTCISTRDFNKVAKTTHHEGHIFNSGVDVEVDFRLSGKNPVMTANFMIASARAAARAVDAGIYGARTIPEIAPVDFVKGRTIAERLDKIRC